MHLLIPCCMQQELIPEFYCGTIRTSPHIYLSLQLHASFWNYRKWWIFAEYRWAVSGCAPEREESSRCGIATMVHNTASCSFVLSNIAISFISVYRTWKVFISVWFYSKMSASTRVWLCEYIGVALHLDSSCSCLLMPPIFFSRVKFMQAFHFAGQRATAFVDWPHLRL